MKLLLTNDELHEVRGGTQVFVMDLAKALQERGHEVAVYAWLRGSLAEELTQAGVPVVAVPADCGFVPDLIHGQHHLATMTALTAFPTVPVVYHCHGYAPWQERPPVHPSIICYLGMSRAMVHWMAAVTGRKSEDIVVLPNSVRLDRFRRVREPRQTPKRALLFGNSFIPGEYISRLRSACRKCGITLEFAGAPFGNATSTPEELLPDFDIVFAVGRSALEAMACGCAVFPFSVLGCGPLLCPETLETWGGRNFTVPERGFPVDVNLMTNRIKTFNPSIVSAVTTQIRSNATFARTCEQLETLYQTILQRWLEHPQPTPGEASRAVSAYLASLGPYIKGSDQRIATLRLQHKKSKERLGRLKLRLQVAEDKWNRMQARLPGFLRRWLRCGLE